MSDKNKSTEEIIKDYGYAFEIHHLVTEDGYILELHRIPCSKSGQKPTRNHPSFFHHGIYGSSADFLLSGANTSLPLQLADDGYDVWLTNCRGNAYSRKHKTLSYTENAFWDFSLNEIGKYDIPAAIDYVLTNTKSSQVHYIGFSMGTTVFYVMGSERPEYHSKIRSQVSLAPVAYLYNTTSAEKYKAPYAHALNNVCQVITSGMFFTETWIQKVIDYIKSHNEVIKKQNIEKLLLFYMFGCNPRFCTFDSISKILGRHPEITSSKLVEHYAQLILNDYFAQYNYGSPENNIQHYNAAEPPLYDLRSIQVPITLIHGKGDILADIEDVMKLKDQLPKLMDIFSPDDPDFNHGDFLYSSTVNKDINNPVKKILMTTDDMNWVYTGPKPTNRHQNISNLKEWHPPQILPNFEPGLDYFEKNLEAIIASTLPKLVYEEENIPLYKQKYDNLISLFRKLIEFIKSSTIQNDQNDYTIAYQNLNKFVSFATQLNSEQIPLKNELK